MRDVDYKPGGPLCACEVCEDIRDEYGIEELTPDLIALSEMRQAEPPTFIGMRTVRTAQITGGAL